MGKSCKNCTWLGISENLLMTISKEVPYNDVSTSKDKIIKA